MKETEFIHGLKNLNVKPPQSVWTSIASQLEEENRPKGVWFGFDQRQLATIAAAFLLSTGLCISLIQTIKPAPKENISEPIAQSTEKIQFNTQPEEAKIIPVTSNKEVKSKIEASKPKLSNKPIQSPKATPKKEITQKISSQPIDKVKTEEQNFNSALAEVLASEVEKEDALLEKKVAKAEQKTVIAKQKEKKVVVSEPKVEKKEVKKSVKPIMVANLEPIKSEFVSPNLGSLNIYENTSKIEAMPEVKLPQVEEVAETKVETPKTTIPFRRFYVMPYVGTNFMQVSYPNKSNSPYFSENAKFTGKIGYNFGIGLGLRLSKHWSLESAIATGQYIQSFKEDVDPNTQRSGVMYIDQVDIPFMGRYSIFFGRNYPQSLSFKGGLHYASVYKYQVNYSEYDRLNNSEKIYNIEADKRQYNSLQLGFVGGIDYDNYLSKLISFNMSMMTSLVSQLQNFPTFNKEYAHPLQFSTGFSVGVKFHFK